MKRSKIIYQPKKIRKYRRKLEVFLKMIFSALTFAATIALWLLFMQYIWKMLFTEDTFDDTARMFALLLSAALLAFFTILFWEQYNLRMFGKKNRRQFAPSVPDSTISEIYSIHTQDINILKQAKSIWLEENKDHNRCSWYTDKGETILTGPFSPDINKKG